MSPFDICQASPDGDVGATWQSFLRLKSLTAITPRRGRRGSGMAKRGVLIWGSVEAVLCQLITGSEEVVDWAVRLGSR